MLSVDMVTVPGSWYHGPDWAAAETPDTMRADVILL